MIFAGLTIALIVLLLDPIYSLYYIVLNCTELDTAFINQHNGKKLCERTERFPPSPPPSLPRPRLRRLISVCDNYKLCANYVTVGQWDTQMWPAAIIITNCILLG